METTLIETKTKWTIDTLNSQIGFKVKYLVFSNVRGNFKEFDATVYTTGEDFTNVEIDFRINAASIDTGIEKRDTHLKSADFFDVANYPELKFTGTSFKKIDDENYQLKGILTIKDVSKEVALDVEFGGINKDPWGNEKAGFSINGKINRKDWGLNWNAALETGGVLVSEEVKIAAEVQFVKQA